MKKILLIQYLPDTSELFLPHAGAKIHFQVADQLKNPTVLFKIDDKAVEVVRGVNSLNNFPQIPSIKPMKSIKDLETLSNESKWDLIIVIPFDENLTNEIKPEEYNNNEVACGILLENGKWIKTLYP